MQTWLRQPTCLVETITVLEKKKQDKTDSARDKDKRYTEIIQKIYRSNLDLKSSRTQFCIWLSAVTPWIKSMWYSDTVHSGRSCTFDVWPQQCWNKGGEFNPSHNTLVMDVNNHETQPRKKKGWGKATCTWTRRTQPYDNWLSVSPCEGANKSSLLPEWALVKITCLQAEYLLLFFLFVFLLLLNIK